MRASLVDSLEAYEAAGAYDDPTYLELVDKEFYRKHVCRLDTWPEDVTDSFARLNYKLYDLMQGPSEFKVEAESSTGTSRPASRRSPRRR